MRILLAGTPAMVIPLFDKIFSSDISIAGVLTNPPKSQGRSSKLIPSPVSTWALEHALKIFQSGQIEECREILQDVDLVFVVAFGKLIPEKLLALPKRGWVNLHFSTLPEARGAAPVQRLIVAGREEIGSTLFKIDAGMDTGPVYHFNKPIRVSGLTTGEAWIRLVAEAAKDIVENLKEIALGKSALPQNGETSGVSVAPKVTTEEARIHWEDSSELLIRKILAFNPTPSVWTTFRGDRFIIHRARANAIAASGPLRTIRVTKNGVYLSASGGEIELLEVQPAGKKRMSAIEWANGSRCHDGEYFD